MNEVNIKLYNVIQLYSYINVKLYSYINEVNIKLYKLLTNWIYNRESFINRDIISTKKADNEVNIKLCKQLIQIPN